MTGVDPIISPDRAATDWLGGIPVFFAPSGAPAVLVTVMAAWSTDEQIDDSLRFAQRSGALVFALCRDEYHAREIAADFAVKLPGHNLISYEHAATGCWGMTAQ
jgi:hypothetical protein